MMISYYLRTTLSKLLEQLEGNALEGEHNIAVSVCYCAQPSLAHQQDFRILLERNLFWHRTGSSKNVKKKSSFSVGILSIMLEYNLSWPVAKTITFRGRTFKGRYCPKGLHCSPFSQIMAALFPLNTGPISNNVAHICPLNTKWWENSVQVVL